ncbi:Sec-independent protein translocase subunit TatA/TatB [Halomicrobium salinisoli]|uniref:Sec-independent protein translocase subunit TatA/TatB n=1 Tax=Halomicrobium salinisoli TaxID=2878391 RepID=UPI001CEFE21F|nr:twin-arginine translocase TatA/TatE family subunit [Halomicrobium salinisoli]
MPGTQEMMIILALAIMLFGAQKIPKLARSTGEAMGEFKKGRRQVEQELNELKEESGESASGENAKTASSEPVRE